MAGGHPQLIPGVKTRNATSKLPEPLLLALDDYVERVGSTRSRVVRALVEGLLVREAPDLLREHNMPAETTAA